MRVLATSMLPAFTGCSFPCRDWTKVDLWHCLGRGRAWRPIDWVGATPCTLHVSGSGLIGRLAGRVGLPGATFCPLCHEYLGGTRAPAGWPRCKPSGELRLERQYRD